MGRGLSRHSRPSYSGIADLAQRAPDPASLTFWTNALQNGSVTRGGLLVSFLQTPEFAAQHPLVATENIVNMAYTGLWNRNPDSHFASAVKSFTSTAALGNTFIKGQHYTGSNPHNGNNDVMSCYDSRALPLGALAEKYTIDDDFFTPASAGPSSTRFFWLPPHHRSSRARFPPISSQCSTATQR